MCSLEMRLPLTPQIRSFLSKAAICASIATATATAQSSTPIGGVTKSDAAWIGVAVAAIGAGIGIGIYVAVHHGHRLNGCAVMGANGLQLQNKGDGQTYALSGDIAAIKPGEHVRVSGKKAKAGSSATPQFIVENLSKDYGACKEQPATP